MLLLGVILTSSCHSSIIAFCLYDMHLSEILIAGYIKFLMLVEALTKCYRQCCMQLLHA